MREKYDLPTKITQPKVIGAEDRHELFTKLDGARGGAPVVVVVGPPGSGKTTLISSWLASHGRPAVWYQVDGSDADPASFFHYFGNAVTARVRGRHRALAAYGPAYAHDLAGFARRFFRDVFARLPAGAVVVLDDLQEVPKHHELHRLLAGAALELPQGMTWIMVSRDRTPGAYARVIASARATFVEWDQLRYPPDLAARVIARRHPELTAHATTLYALSGGWPAGLTLLTETWRPGQPPLPDESSAALDTVFDYLAGEFFDHLRPRDQRILLDLSLAPPVTAVQAAHITGDGAAGRLLDSMYRSGLFVTRDGQSPHAYDLHGLLRAFLRHRAGCEMPAQTRQEIIRRAAGSMAVGQSEAAVALYLEGGDSAAARDAILLSAASLLEQGRWRTLDEQISALPRDAVERDARLLYWRGLARSHTDLDLAREDLRRARDRATADADAPTKALACAAAILTFELEFAGFAALDEWVDGLRTALEDPCILADADVALRAFSALTIGAMHRRPDDPRMAEFVGMVLDLCGRTTDSNARVDALRRLLSWACHTGDIGLAPRVIDTLRGLTRTPALRPENAALTWSSLSWYYCLVSDRENCLDAIARVEHLCDEHGLAGGSLKVAAHNGA